jgi:hypothetical protein
MPQGYQTLSIPKQMYSDVDRFIKNNPRLGYSSVPEFIKDSIRKNLGAPEPLETVAAPIRNIPVGSPIVDSLRVMYTLMSRNQYNPIKFNDVIFASTNYTVIPFNRSAGKEFLGILERSLKNLKPPEIQQTDLSSTIEYQTEYLKNQVITDLEKSKMTVEELTGGGYPDLAVENVHHQTTYITLKVSMNQKYHKEFYYVSSKKIRKDAEHLLIEADFAEMPDKRIAHYCIRDLSTLVLVLDAEFRGSPKSIDRTTSVLAEFQTRDRDQQHLD